MRNKILTNNLIPYNDSLIHHESIDLINLNPNDLSGIHIQFIYRQGGA
jgi:hypothetical protein